MQGPEVQARNPANPRRPVGRVTARILRKVWHLRVAKTGFHDLENPDNPDAPLSTVGTPSHLFDRDAARSLLIDASGSDEPPDDLNGVTGRVRVYQEWTREAVETTAEYYRRIEHLAWRFGDETERAVAVGLSNGHGVRRIKAELHVGQRRIERVMRQIKIWMKESREGEDCDG